jgi:hypothetical protein
LSQVLCFTRSELTQQLLSISFHHQDTPVFEHFLINIRHGRFGFSDEFKQELKCRDLCWEFSSYRNEVNRDFNEMGSKRSISGCLWQCLQDVSIMPLIINMSVKKIGSILNSLSCLPKESRWLWRSKQCVAQNHGSPSWD